MKIYIYIYISDGFKIFIILQAFLNHYTIDLGFALWGNWLIMLECQHEIQLININIPCKMVCSNINASYAKFTI